MTLRTKEGGKLQFWEGPTPLGLAYHADCCPCGGCGCDLCFPQGDVWEGTSTSNCAALNGLKKYFVKEGGCWYAEHDTSPTDRGYDGCLFLNPGIPLQRCRICCDLLTTVCPGASGCYDYYLDWHAYECSLDFKHCADACDCTPLSDFTLTFTNLPVSGGVNETPPPPYLCGCSCDWGSGITISWTFTRLLHCCCVNIETDPAPGGLTAAIQGITTCAVDMEGKYIGLVTNGKTSSCWNWESDGDLTFECADADTHYMHIDLECDHIGGPDDGECCTDFKMTLTFGTGEPGSCCAADCNNQTSYAHSSCGCTPLNLRFGPFKWWWNTGGADPDCCECCEQFYIWVTQ